MENYTKIPNKMLNKSQLSVQARYLYCVLLKYCGKDEYCYPSQKTLGKVLGYSQRHIRTLLNELIENKLVSKRRSGWNRANTYKVSKSLVANKKSGSVHLGSKFPIHQGTKVPPKSTYLKGKGKRSKKGLKKVKDILKKKGLNV